MEDSERATTSGDPATMKASEKSEAVLAGEKLPETKPQKKASSRRSSRAKATASRKSKAKAA